MKVRRNESKHERNMAAVYSKGEMARIVRAGGNKGFKNLGCSKKIEKKETSSARQLNLVRLVLDQLKLENGSRRKILDAGFGTGGCLIEVSRRFPSTEVCGINIDDNQTRIAKQRFIDLGKQAQLVTGNAEEMPFEDNNFDIVYSIELLSHIKSKSSFFSEISRVIKSNGVFVIAYIALNRKPSALEAPIRDILQKNADYFSENVDDIPTREEVESLLTEGGFKMLNNTDLTDLVYEHRYQDFICVRNTIIRLSSLPNFIKTALVKWKWGVDADYLYNFLSSNIQRHPCRDYEYWLTTWEKSSD